MAAEEDRAEPAQRLSEFRLDALDGRSFESAELLGGLPAVIMFWRVDQEASVRALKDLGQLYEEVPREEVAIVSIVAGAVDRTRVKHAADEQQVAFPVLFDPERAVYTELGGIVNPSTWFIARDGSVVGAYPGHRRDFMRVARANIDLLRGRIDDAGRSKRLRPARRQGAGPAIAGPATRYRLALRLLEKGRREAALTQLRQAWEGNPPLVDAGVKLGLLLLEDARDREALKILERASELAPGNALASGARGAALVRLGQEEDVGAELLRRALEGSVTEPLLYYEMGRLSERSEAPDEARRYYRKGLESTLGAGVTQGSD